jgi:hypothetical protein
MLAPVQGEIVVAGAVQFMVGEMRAA